MAPAAELYPMNPAEKMAAPSSPVFAAMYVPTVTAQAPKDQYWRNIIAERRNISPKDERCSGSAWGMNKATSSDESAATASAESAVARGPPVCRGPAALTPGMPSQSPRVTEVEDFVIWPEPKED